MQDRLIRPSMKGVWVLYLLALVIFAAGVWAWFTYAGDKPVWLTALPLVAFLPALKAHLRCRLITMRVHDGHLTIESGFLSRVRRTVDMAKIQDVTVSQTFAQRLAGVGDLRLESAGESGVMGIRGINHPRQTADLILAAANRLHRVRGSGAV